MSTAKSAKKKKTTRPEPKPDVRVEVLPLSAFRSDPQNANDHTKRGQELLEDSLRTRGFARPVFAARDGTLLGGNLTIDGARAVGMDSAIVIRTDGRRPIIHVREDLSDPASPEARKLAIEDNRIAQVSLNWNPEELLRLREMDSEILSDLFTDAELSALAKVDTNGTTATASGSSGTDVDEDSAFRCPSCGFEWTGSPK